MNYTRIAINGKDYGLKFGMYSARYLSDKLQNQFAFQGDEITEIGISHVIYGGYMNNCAVKEEIPELTFENIVDFVEGALLDTEKIGVITAAVNVWSQSQIIKTAADGEAKKKTSPLKKSKG